MRDDISDLTELVKARVMLKVELIDTRELTNTAKHRLTQTDTDVSISWTGARTY
jgi:hypothetical protein